ncbi:MAG: hypothetical protein SFZ03_04555 [Candidatus Melainabacteria bacterium]|nr:hypothetical protein [Candidatus Melainabacteria bacterium]
MYGYGMRPGMGGFNNCYGGGRMGGFGMPTMGMGGMARSPYAMAGAYNYGRGGGVNMAGYRPPAMGPMTTQAWWGNAGQWRNGALYQNQLFQGNRYQPSGPAMGFYNSPQFNQFNQYNQQINNNYGPSYNAMGNSMGMGAPQPPLMAMLPPMAQPPVFPPPMFQAPMIPPQYPPVMAPPVGGFLPPIAGIPFGGGGGIDFSRSSGGGPAFASGNGSIVSITGDDNDVRIGPSDSLGWANVAMQFVLGLIGLTQAGPPDIHYNYNNQRQYDVMANSYPTYNTRNQYDVSNTSNTLHYSYNPRSAVINQNQLVS